MTASPTGTVEHLPDECDWSIEADYRVADFSQPHSIGGGPDDWDDSDAEAPSVDLTSAWLVYDGARVSEIPLAALPKFVAAELERAAQSAVEEQLECAA